jgi:Holliday junction DNA helicase RuvA
LGDRIFLHTYLVVREDSLELFGFGEAETRRLFELLMGVSGVGPRLALATVSHLPGDAIRRAVGGQPELLTRVPGVGRKTAEKIAFELKDKLGEPGLPIEPPSELDGEVLGVLTSLGYSLVEGQAAVQSLAEDAPEELEARVRLALRYFAKP